MYKYQFVFSMKSIRVVVKMFKYNKKIYSIFKHSKYQFVQSAVKID